METVALGTDTAPGVETVVPGTETVAAGIDTAAAGVEAVVAGTETVVRGTETEVEGTEAVSPGMSTPEATAFEASAPPVANRTTADAAAAAERRPIR